MTRTTEPPVADNPPRTSTLDRPTLMRLAATEYDRFGLLLRDLDTEDWERPTDCPGWNVRAVAGHVLGMAEMAASFVEGRRQQKAAQKRGGLALDALTALQVEERAGLSVQQLMDRFDVVGARAARARRRIPGLIRRRRLPDAQLVGGSLEIWTLGYLIDTVLTRDPWMHRIDIARATGRSLDMTPEHDGVLIADVVTDWAGRHQEPCRSHLTGPAGGTWTFGVGGTVIDIDAIVFCRTVSGREPATGLLATQVPF